MKNKKRKAFTLIELLVVMAIMGILTIITVSQFETARRKARDVQRKGDLSALQKALLIYYADYNEFPETINNDAVTSDLWCTEADCEFDDGTGEPEGVYMKVLPVENRDGQPPYCYVVSDDGKQFALYGILENTDDIDCRQDDGAFRFQGKCGDNNYCLIYASPNVNKEVGL
jgi:prepilin-type N-terminal cleavage/methylation domain-containing protein